MSLNSVLATPPVMAESESALWNLKTAEGPNVVDADPAASGPEFVEDGSALHESGMQAEDIPSPSTKATTLQNVQRNLKSNEATSSPNVAWERDVLLLLSKIQEELAAGKPSKVDLTQPVSSKEKVISIQLPEEVRKEEARRLFGVLSQVDSVKTSGGKTYNYEEKYPEDAPGDELGADARVFKVYNDEAEKYDADMIRGFRDSFDGLLVFASLFSAVVTTILMETLQAFPTDQSRIANYLLYETTLLLRANGNSTTINSIPLSPYGPDSVTIGRNDIWINALFITSLVLSLTTALLSVLAKQWLQAYTTATSGAARDVALIRHLRFTGLEQWKMNEIIGALPIILYTSLGLFFAGLFVFMRTMYPPFGWIIISISGVTFLIYLGTVILPKFHLECPYRLPLFYRSLENAERTAVSHGSSSRHADPAGSCTWLSTLSSNATVKHIVAWSIASDQAWEYLGVWDFLTFDMAQMLFKAVWEVDEQNTVAARAVGQLVAKAHIPSARSMTALQVKDVWRQIFAPELHRVIEQRRANYASEILAKYPDSANVLLNGSSPLEAAVIRGDLEMVKLLVTKGRANTNMLLKAVFGRRWSGRR
ncbi:hypothetical protein DL96DRAFT_868247 [Flagelloscypha sp. PMI_526]|nr:hypothetical protein DL96DRAFT_868247 [Flagelloscypha sp. PMI_526]